MGLRLWVIGTPIIAFLCRLRPPAWCSRRSAFNGEPVSKAGGPRFHASIDQHSNLFRVANIVSKCKTNIEHRVTVPSDPKAGSLRIAHVQGFGSTPKSFPSRAAREVAARLTAQISSSQPDADVYEMLLGWSSNFEHVHDPSHPRMEACGIQRYKTSLHKSTTGDEI